MTAKLELEFLEVPVNAGLHLSDHRAFLLGIA